MNNFKVFVTDGSDILVPDTGATRIISDIDPGITSLISILFPVIVVLILLVGFIWYKSIAKHNFVKKTTKRILKATALTLILSSILVPKIVNEINRQDYAKAISDRLSITVEDFNLVVEATEKENFAYAPHTVKINTGTEAGYTLGVFASNKNLEIDSSASEGEGNTQGILGLEDNSAPTTLPLNTWGVALTEPQDKNSAVWQAVSDKSNSLTILKSEMLATEKNTETTVYYGVNAGNNLELGEYSTTINYVAVANVISENLKDQSGVISYEDSKSALLNPDRGLYTPILIDLNKNTNLFGNKGEVLNRVSTSVNDKISIMHLRVNLAPFSGNANGTGEDQPLTAEQVASISDILDILRKFNAKAIIRFAYDYSGRVDQEPKSLDTVLGHINALKPVFAQNEDVITALEVGILGPYGEMHSLHGIYAQDSTLRAVVNGWLDVLPESITANVRTPSHYRTIFGSLDNDSPNRYRVGIFNDGYLGSSSDLGTFNSGITRDMFIEWMKTQGNYTYYGGEVTKIGSSSSDYTPDMEPWSDGDYAAYEMPLTHTSYLNSQFNLKILNDKWKNQIYQNSDSEYNNETYYKYITDHLGYRIIVRNSKISERAKSGELAAVKFNLENVGFARIIKSNSTYLILAKDGYYYQTKLDTNISNLMSGTKNDYLFTFSVPSEIAEGEWDVYLRVANAKSNNYPIQFANPNIYEENLGANKLGSIIIEKGTKTGVEFHQLNTLNPSDETSGAITPKPSYVPVIITYLRLDNLTQLGQEQLLLARGSTIDFNNLEQLKALGFHLPSKYINPQAASGFNGWQLTKTLTLPNKPSDTEYWVNVYLEEHLDPDFVFTFVQNGVTVGTSNARIAPGTVLDVNKPEELAALGINIPDGYKVLSLASGPFTNWANVERLEIPATATEPRYWITVAVTEQQDPNPVFVFTFVDGSNNTTVGTVNVKIAPGTVLDVNKPEELAELGIIVPDGYRAYLLASGPFTNWAGVERLEIPADATDATYWITVMVNRR